MKVKVSDIKVNPGRRGASEKDIEELAFSIEKIGLLNPITLTEDHTLIAELHRLEAVKQLGWTEVECTITGRGRRRSLPNWMRTLRGKSFPAGTGRTAGPAQGNL